MVWSQGADGGEKIQAVFPTGAVRDGAVLGIRFVCSFLQDFQHGKDLLYDRNEKQGTVCCLQLLFDQYIFLFVLIG